MILNVNIREDWGYAENLDDMRKLCRSAMGVLRDGRDIAWFGFSDKRHSGTVGPDNNLRVVVDRESGYGGIVWFVDRRSPKTGGIFDHVWVSDNPEPPVVDPRVVSDLWVPVYFDRRSVIPIAQIYEVVDDFCAEGTGERPNSVNWVLGEANGKRLFLEAK